MKVNVKSGGNLYYMLFTELEKYSSRLNNIINTSEFTFNSGKAKFTARLLKDTKSKDLILTVIYCDYRKSIKSPNVDELTMKLRDYIKNTFDDEESVVKSMVKSMSEFKSKSGNSGLVEFNL